MKHIIFSATCMLASMTYAADLMPTNGFGLGAEYATFSAGDFALMLNYTTPKFFIAMGGNYEHLGEGKNVSIKRLFEIRGNVGGRYALPKNTFFTAGLTGAYVTESPHPYQGGAFVGLDYYLSSHLFIGVKILPFSREKDLTGRRTSTYFEDGTFSMTYTF